MFKVQLKMETSTSSKTYIMVSEFSALNLHDWKCHAGEKLVITIYHPYKHMMMFGCRLYQGPGEHRAKPGESPSSSSPRLGEFNWWWGRWVWRW
jgi:hypothetical protein